ncbi:MAG TPA: alpha/beta fold hydrolase [Candidatus Polarisedimenticolia bacterium]|nr:alpha/beta fold hydrolase [Candidatus Polarisedimenticolia bacterium]
MRRFQNASRSRKDRPGVCVATEGRAKLIQYEPVFPANPGLRPVVFVPSLINPPDVLDLAPDNSLLRFLAGQGHRTFRIDWGTPQAADRKQDIAAHVTDLLLPLLTQLPEAPVLVGYCLGGTMAIAAASLIRCTALATIAAPWYFDAYPEAFRTQTGEAWNASRTACDRLGLMPMEVLQGGFWSLDPRRTIAKYADFADMSEDDPGYTGFLLLEDWVNEGAPLTFAAGCELIEQFYEANIPGTGGWQVGGRIIDPATLPCPTFAIASTTDKLVPYDATPPATENLSLDLGHVGMVVGRSAPNRLWEPLSAWLTRQGA